MKWKTDLQKKVLLQNFERLGLIPSVKENDWNLYWANVVTIRELFSPDTHFRLSDSQIINHFPNHYELTRKDLLIKNLKQYCRDLPKKQAMRTANAAIPSRLMLPHSDPAPLDYQEIVPMTYVLPKDYSLMIDEFKKSLGEPWILKPCDSAQGKGIKIIKRIEQLKKWEMKRFGSKEGSGYPHVISKYILHPLLIGGKKFDMRLYVLVTNYRPLTVYVHELGFGRFCATNYGSSAEDLDNLQSQLTNVAQQKQSEFYNPFHGGKMSVKNIRLHLEMAKGREKTDKCFEDVLRSIWISLKSVQDVITNDKHCFELYGYDIIIDSDLKAWLLEVNASPALTTTTKSDSNNKMTLLYDTFRIVLPPSWVRAEPAKSLFTKVFSEGEFETTEELIRNKSRLIWR